ncbi:MAG: SagB/ThcOx family dehydrogenase [Psychromonas sp.]
MTLKRIGTSELVSHYHQKTKHYPNRPANSLGYMDWQNQPIPFRSYPAATQIQLPVYEITDSPLEQQPYTSLYQQNCENIAAISFANIATMLSLSMGLSAWKKYVNSEWALRVNPSSGNLHPTECYLILPSFTDRPACLTHYHPYIHVLEELGGFDHAQTQSLTKLGGFGLILTSIPWREAWKYGERAYRYCQHDLGHALAAVRIACNLNGWIMSIIPQVNEQTLDRFLDIQAFNGEEETADCLCWISIAEIDTVQVAQWFEHQKMHHYKHAPNQLSSEHQDWAIINQVQQAVHLANSCEKPPENTPPTNDLSTNYLAIKHTPINNTDIVNSAQEIIFNRRSAQSYDQVKSQMRVEDFMHSLSCTLPSNTCPFDVFPYQAQVHLAIFVHAINGLAPGLYLLLRNAQHLQQLKNECDQRFLWQEIDTQLPLYLLEKGNFRQIAQEISCNQEIASESAFSLGMIAQFKDVISKQPQQYPRLFWETGLIGQVLYLQAEAFNLRGTGIGCFFDDQMHQLLGLQNNKWQSLYHFTIGKAREDIRIETKAPYYHLQR